MRKFHPSGCGAPGEWTYYACTDSYNAYTLSCGSLFLIHLRQSGGRIYYSFNGRSAVTSAPLDKVMLAAERELVKRVRDMLPAYHAIHSRVKSVTAQEVE